MYWLGTLGFIVFLASLYMIVKLKPVEAIIFSVLGLFISYMGWGTALLNQAYYQVANNTSTTQVLEKQMAFHADIAFIAIILNGLVLFIGLLIFIYQQLSRPKFPKLKPIP